MALVEFAQYCAFHLGWSLIFEVRAYRRKANQIAPEWVGHVGSLPSSTFLEMTFR
jgi:hypothetical protein